MEQKKKKPKQVIKKITLKDRSSYISSVLPLCSPWAGSSSKAPVGKCSTWDVIHMLLLHRIEAHTRENSKAFSNEGTSKALLDSPQPHHIIERLRSCL